MRDFDGVVDWSDQIFSRKSKSTITNIRLSVGLFVHKPPVILHLSSFIFHSSFFILYLLSFIHHLSSCIFHLLSSFSAYFGTTYQHSSFNTFHGFIKPFKKCISETVYQLTYHSQSHSQHHLKLLRINSRGNCSSWSRDKLGVRVERKLGQPCTNIWWKWV